MPVIQEKVYNVLVLGETGAGKSTFINGFFNYLSFENLNEALASSEKSYCIPTMFTWYTENDSYEIVIGRNEDKFEHQQTGQSATQNVRSYLFKFDNMAIRIIDTPGFGDTEGKAKDEQICEKLFNFLSIREELRELHGIILVYHPQANRKTTFFQYCIEHILSKLHSDASQNIIFAFTHTKATNYRPGATASLLKDVLKNIPNSNIKCTKENIFCIENDCIKFLLAFRYNTDGISFDDNERDNYIKPWEKSTESYLRLVQYIKGLEPHSVSDTVLINSSRHYIVKLKSFLPTIINEIEQKIKGCEEKEKAIKDCEDDIEKLEKVLYMDTFIKREGGRRVVCKNLKCPKKGTHGKNKVACCLNCKAWSLTLCLNIYYWSSKCKVCGCYQLDHVFESGDCTDVEREKDINIEKNVNSKQQVINTTRLVLFGEKIKIKKYISESKYIEYWLIRLSAYLQEASILSDQRTFESTDSTTNEVPITAEVIKTILTTLTNLEMTGESIRQLLNSEKKAIETDKILYCDNVPTIWWDTLEQSL